MPAKKQQISFQGNTIGLLGGSFNPPHSGHVHISHQAFKVLGLKKIWWLVTPGNPLKVDLPIPLKKRISDCEKIVQNPNVIISDLEYRLNTRFTAETLKKLFLCYPGVKFVWLMGADNLINFHHWDKWTWIMENVPVGVMARPGAQIKAGLSQTALRYRKFRVRSSDAAVLPFMQAPAWSLLGGPMKDVSSTQLRLRSRKNSSSRIS